MASLINGVKRVSFDFLPKNEVVIKVHYAGLNYKDALSATGHKGITRNYPHTPGVDAAGTIVSDSTGKFSEGDKVICTSYDLGMNTPGGCAEYISVPASWGGPIASGNFFKRQHGYGHSSLYCRVGAL